MPQARSRFTWTLLHHWLNSHSLCRVSRRATVTYPSGCAVPLLRSGAPASASVARVSYSSARATKTCWPCSSTISGASLRKRVACARRGRCRLVRRQIVG